MTEKKPKMFIGCSREAINYARAVHDQVKRFVQATPWYAGVFGANSYTMESLEEQLNSNDFGVFVFAPDDVALIRGKYVFVTRDNTLFEMGLFWGKLRRKRVFCIVPNNVPKNENLIKDETIEKLHILSDLTGLTLLEYENDRDDDNFNAAVDVACGEILRKIEKEGSYKDPIKILEQKVEKQAEEVESRQCINRFFWEYNRYISIGNQADRFNALAEAVRVSLLSPVGFHVRGAAVWEAIDSEGLYQVGGNVGKGQFFPFNANHYQGTKINVLDAFYTGDWSFFEKEDVAPVYILCYPLNNKYVLSFHISGSKKLNRADLETIMNKNNDLFRVIALLIGGDSK